MLKDKAIAIISYNTLSSIGLREILLSYFEPRIIEIYNNYEGFLCNESNFDLIYTYPDIYVSHLDEFQNIKSNVIILSDKDGVNSGSTRPAFLNITLPEPDLVSEIEKLASGTFKHQSSENSTEELSSREIDVLKLVSMGKLNKQIADQLNISMHTVISHRKNITRKLGIKTVSGLTVYALMNGLISTNEMG